MEENGCRLYDQQTHCNRKILSTIAFIGWAVNIKTAQFNSPPKLIPLFFTGFFENAH